MTQHDDSDDAEDPPTGNRGPLIGLGVIVLLVLAGLWLMRVLGTASSVQDCLASGRTNCAPLATGDR